MKEYLHILKENILFDGFCENQILSILFCMGSHVQSFVKNSFIFTPNTKVSKIGILLSGGLNNIKLGYDGNQNIIAKISPSQMFGESIVCSESHMHTVCVVATMDSLVLFLDYSKILNVCNNSCSFHILLIKNMLKLLAEKNLFLNGKLEHISKRSTREKLLSYLTEQSQLNGSKIFDIRLNRQELADYLFIERSAMSAELSRMQNDGLIEYQKNSFKLL